MDSVLPSPKAIRNVRIERHRINAKNPPRLGENRHPVAQRLVHYERARRPRRRADPVRARNSHAKHCPACGRI
jgi:hypothetical protein